ncbi:aminopeptidase P family protein [Streptomyces tanashiensis]
MPLIGHRVGLEIDERTRSFSPRPWVNWTLVCRLTVEPGVGLPGRGGVRIDDTLVVRQEADGGAELLTITTKELLAL